MAEPWLILGAGSIGGLWAARLHQAGQSPTLLLREDAYPHYTGLTIEGEGVVPVVATTATQLKTPIKRLLVCCKSYQTMDALRPLSPHLNADTSLVLVQNGMGVAEQITAHFPELKLYCGTTTKGANRTDRFAIRPAGAGDTVIGGYNAAATEATVLAASLSCNTFKVTASDDIAQLLWRKLAINCAINPLTVRYRCRNGELLENTDALQDLNTICDEVSAVSQALGHALPNLTQTVIQVARQTGANRSSMLQDVEAGRRTEIDAITGYLCQQARRVKVATPVNDLLLQQIVSTHSPH